MSPLMKVVRLLERRHFIYILHKDINEEVMHCIMNWLVIWRRLTPDKQIVRNSYTTLSKVFFKSNFENNFPFFLFDLRMC